MAGSRGSLVRSPACNFWGGPAYCPCALVDVFIDFLVACYLHKNPLAVGRVRCCPFWGLMTDKVVFTRFKCLFAFLIIWVRSVPVKVAT